MREDEGERDRAGGAIETAQQLEEYFRNAYRSEVGYTQALASSACVHAYEEAKGEVEAVRQAREPFPRSR